MTHTEFCNKIDNMTEEQVMRSAPYHITKLPTNIVRELLKQTLRDKPQRPSEVYN